MLSILHCLCFYVLDILCLKNSLFYLSIATKNGDGWIITTIWLIIGLLILCIWLPSEDESNKLSFFLAFRHKPRAYLKKFTRKRWSWKDWMHNGDNCKATTQTWTMLEIVLLEAPLIRYMVCRIMMVIRGFHTILQAELKASRGLCYLGRHLCFIF